MSNNQRKTARGAVQARMAQDRGAVPHINQHSAHLLRTVQAKMAKSPANVIDRRAASHTVQPKMQTRTSGPSLPARKSVSASVVNNRFSSVVQRAEGQPKAVAPVPPPDPVVEAVIDKDKAAVKSMVDTTMTKIRLWILREDRNTKAIASALRRSGRDWFVYAPIQSWISDLGQLLENWSDKWTLEETTGLMIDLSLALRKVVADSLGRNDEVMNTLMAASRQKNKSVNRESAWVQEFVPEGAKVQSGASATTGLLLRLLQVADTSPQGIEAVMNGLYHYWNGKDGPWGARLKQLRGEYHTAVEIWGVYMFYLQQLDPGPKPAKL